MNDEAVGRLLKKVLQADKVREGRGRRHRTHFSLHSLAKSLKSVMFCCDKCLGK
jgi:hypothetical protein